jgi:hypothetical protein
MTISGRPSRTDSERIRKSIADDEPIPYDANDPDDGPYDPNDDEAVDRFLNEANLVRVPKADKQPTSKAS